MTKKKKKSRIYIIWIVNLCLITAVVAFFVWYESVPDVSPEKVLKTYMAHISNREYEQMYEMIDAGISGNISQEDFMKRNSAIYEGIGFIIFPSLQNAEYIQAICKGFTRI